MNDYPFTFATAAFCARADGALWWPDEGILCVSDLHLGKSERIARRGGTLLPPYETRETLARLELAIAATRPKTVICLGDSFDDLGAALALPQDMQNLIAQLQAGREWVWIEGNHDPGPVHLGGTHLQEVVAAGITFRHIAIQGEAAEISGHYHPKAGVPGLAPRRCFLIDGDRIILPAFGAYTGGMHPSDPPLCDLIRPDAVAVLTGKRATPMPVAAALKKTKFPR